MASLPRDMTPGDVSLGRWGDGWYVPVVTLFVVLAVVLAIGVTGATQASDAANVTVYDAEGTTLTDADAVTAAIENGTLPPADRVVAGETLVVAIHSDRLADDLAARNGSTTARFLDALDDEADFWLAQTNPTPERQRKVVRIGPRNATVYRAGNTTFVRLDTGAFDYRWGSVDENASTQLRDDEHFAPVFGYDLEEHAHEGPVVELFTTSAEFSSYYRYSMLAPERVNRTVGVNVEPTHTLSVRAVLDSNRTITAPVETPEWTNGPGFSIDFSDVDAGTSYTLQLVHDGDVVDSVDGTVREPVATVRPVRVTVVDNQTYVHVRANLSHGGRVEVLNDDGTRLGSRWLHPPGSSNEPAGESTVAIALRGGEADTLHLQARRTREPTFPLYQGSEARATLDVSDREIRGDSPPVVNVTATPATEPPPSVKGTATPTAVPTSTRTDTETPTPSPTEGSSGHGFGVLLAVGGFLALLLLGDRRG